MEEKNYMMKQINILIVDNNPFNIKVLQDYYLKLIKGYELKILTVSNGSAALEIYEQENKPGSANAIHLILMDLELPIKNGYDTAKGIRDLTNNQKFLPVFIIAFKQVQDEENNYEEGIIDSIFIKPAEEKAFLDAIQLFLKSIILIGKED